MVKKKVFLLSAILLALVAGSLTGILLLTQGDSKIKVLPLTPSDCLNKNIPPPPSLTNTSTNQFLDLKDFSLEVTQSIFRSCTQGVGEIVLIDEEANVEILLRASQLASSTSSPLLLYSTSSLPLAEIRGLSPKQIIFVGTQELQNQYLPQLKGLGNPQTPAPKILSYKTTDLDKLTEEVEKRFQIYELSNIFDTSLTIQQQILDLSQLNNMLASTQNNSTAELQNNAPTWLFKPIDNKHAIVALSAIGAVEGNLFFIEPSEDLRKLTHIGNFINSSTPAGLIGNWTEENLWQLQVLKQSVALPSGKYLLFDNERMIGFYGLLNFSRLGVLGTYSSPADALDGLIPYLHAYQTPDTTLTPAFEIITTVADAFPGEDENYSRRVPIDEIMPWVLEAQKLGVYVILDLQPGRNDFLTQAKEYEELLKFEHVGLALDPEWRLKPDEFHLRQIGSVDAKEVNQVVEWLKNLVRENHLPQKLLMLHQFHISMISNRADINSTPELAVMVHMDGQGALDIKYGSYDILARHLRNEPSRFFGWKNFFFKDIPTPSPEIVLGLEPLPSYISYQ